MKLLSLRFFFLRYGACFGGLLLTACSSADTRDQAHMSPQGQYRGSGEYSQCMNRAGASITGQGGGQASSAAGVVGEAVAGGLAWAIMAPVCAMKYD